MTHHQEVHKLIKDSIKSMPEKDRRAVMMAYASLRGVYDRCEADHVGSGASALALLGSELAAKP